MMFFFGFAMANWVSIKIHFTIFFVTTEILFHYNDTIRTLETGYNHSLFVLFAQMSQEFTFRYI